jgi:Tol biopolymer transport system component
MKRYRVSGLTPLIVLAVLAVSGAGFAVPPKEVPHLILPGEEEHITNLHQLTFGGQNAEGYFSRDGESLLFQAHEKEGECDQIYIMDLATGDVRLVSSGGGVTTCSFFVPNSDEVIYATTDLVEPACPPAPDPSLGYVWPLHSGYEIVRAKRSGEIVQRLTDEPGYDAECAVSPDGGEIVFCSIRSGDLELYKMNIDGSGLVRLTRTLGYDGGPFFSPKGTYIIYRSHHPVGKDEVDRARMLTANEVVSPMRLEIWVMKADGSEQVQVTDLGAASFGPYMHPDEERIIFSSNYSEAGASNKKGMPNFELYLVGRDGTGLERITYNDSFDGFPMFSFDGKMLVFASNRGANEPGETNLFLADWVD